MSEYSSLKATINANVKTNGNQEITGSIMNSVLNEMVNSLGAGYQFMGVATPTNPGSAQTPDYKCFYLATTPGTYTNLGDLVVADGEVALLKWDSAWTKEATGIASQAKLTELGQEIYGGTELYTEDGVIYTSNGMEGNSQYPYKRTGFIAISDFNDIISVHNVGGSASIAALFFYDISKSPIAGSGVGLSDNGVPSIFTASIPSNAAYVRLCTLAAYLSHHPSIVFGSLADLFIKKASQEQVDVLNNDNLVTNGILLKEYTDDALPTKTPNGYWGADGKYYKSENYRTTNPVKVSPGDFMQFTAYGNISHINITDENGAYIKYLDVSSLDNINFSCTFDFSGFIVIAYRAAEGLTYKLWKSDTIRELADYVGFKGTEYLLPSTKTPNGYYGVNGEYYETNSYRTSVPIKVKIGDKLKVTAAGGVAIIARVYPDGRWMSLIQGGADTIQTYNYTSTFNGYITLSWRLQNGLVAEYTSTSADRGNSGVLGGVKWGAMGDSLTDPITLSGQADTRNYVDLIAEQTGVDAINYGKSGSGYKAREAQSEAFYQVALNVASDLDVVTIFGSGNDQNWVTLEQIGNARDTGTDTLCGCMNTAIDNLISVNPLIRIGLVTPSPWKNYPPDSTTATWMKIYAERIVEVAALRGIPCLDLYHDSNLRPWNADCLAALYIDNTHPNTEGHKRIASQIKAFLVEMAG